ncbi:hypothetical protein L1987_34348 [Smallanthus sonchifolius]|uniref:Uncharacterized protein n=1 Tax=Smallanthus sonchifolius TaxID=185202 RepID=A0ACB9HT09_9ASTR|nr:hypothetical protein L1987_34348 [Smallanthus sonchifolius]
MTSLRFLLLSCILLISPQILIQAQQPYVGNSTTDSSNTNASPSVLGYACNGVNQTCQAYLTFRSNPPYNTVVSISNLLNANATQLSQVNSISESSTFGTARAHQSGDTLLLIANNTFQGMSTCHAIQNETSDPTAHLIQDSGLTVPLRCACPTEKQAAAGVSYLLSYLITWGQTVSGISAEFETQTGLTLEANELSANDFIYPFTTLLVPLSNPPKRFQTIAPPPATSVNDHKSVYMLVGILGGM